MDISLSNPMSRRTLLAASGGLIGCAGSGRAFARPSADNLSGNQLYADVMTYSGLGPHRTGARGDNASTIWLEGRLRAMGFAVETPSFVTPLFEPNHCTLTIGDVTIEAFPAWPVVPTNGTDGPLTDVGKAGGLEGAVALVILPYRPGAAFIIPGYGSAVLDAQARGAAAIIVVTQGPTGDIVALNAHLERYAWRVPVILVAGRESARLTELSRSRSSARVVCTGKLTENARATNVLATRAAAPGASTGAIVITTPKSGWFTCAGERGSGIAIFLALAAQIVRTTRRKIIAVATSGHELEGLGGEALLENYAPPPQDVALWTHVGANVASNVVDFDGGRVRRTGAVHPQRGVLVPADRMTAAAEAFVGQPGYAQPIDIMSERAVGEVVIYRRDGYHRLIGVVGGHPLHHTRLDVPANVTSPAVLEPVARGLAALVIPIAMR